MEKLHFLVERTPCFGISEVLIDDVTQSQMDKMVTDVDASLTRQLFQINLLAIQMQQTKPNYTFCGLFAFDKQFLFSVRLLLTYTVKA